MADINNMVTFGQDEIFMTALQGIPGAVNPGDRLIIPWSEGAIVILYTTTTNVSITIHKNNTERGTDVGVYEYGDSVTMLLGNIHAFKMDSKDGYRIQDAVFNNKMVITINTADTIYGSVIL